MMGKARGKEEEDVCIGVMYDGLCGTTAIERNIFCESRNFRKYM